MTTKLLRIYADEMAYFGDRKVFEIVAERARSAHLSGATVLDARIGFGRSAHMHRLHILESDRSVVIEIVDEDKRLRRFVDDIRELSGIGLMTMERVEVLRGDLHAEAPAGAV